MKKLSTKMTHHPPRGPLFKSHEDLLGAISIALLKRTALLPGDAGGEHLRLGFLEEVVALLRGDLIQPGYGENCCLNGD